jgi:hypothetical protein
MESNNKSFTIEIQIPHNESLEQILAELKNWDVDFYEKRKCGITKVELTKKSKEDKLDEQTWTGTMPSTNGSMPKYTGSSN